MSQPWVKTGLSPMLGPLPAWASLPVPYLLLNWGYFSLGIFGLTLALAVFLKSKGRTLTWSIRRVRALLRGHRIEARPIGYRRAVSTDVPLFDFNFEKWRDE